MEVDLLECHVCLEPPTEPVVTSCCHLFCWGCIYKSLQFDVGRRGICPACRTHLRGGIICLHGRHIDVESFGNHIGSPVDDTPFDGTAQSLLTRLESIHANIERSNGQLCGILDVLREGISPVMDFIMEPNAETLEDMVLKQRKLGDLLRDANWGWRPLTEDVVDIPGVVLMLQNIVWRHQAEERIRQQVETRSRVVKRIIGQLRAVASTNYLLPIWYPDHKQATSVPVSKVLLCHICQQPPLSDPVATVCGHLFCWACLYTSLGGQLANPCPACRTALRIDGSIIPVYAGGGSSFSATGAASEKAMIPPRPTQTPSSAVEKRVWHESIKSDPVLTLQRVNHALYHLQMIPAWNNQEMKIVGGSSWRRGGDVTVGMFKSMNSSMVTQAEGRVGRHLWEWDIWRRIALNTQNLLREPIQFM